MIPSPTYDNEVAQAAHDSQQAFGLEKYGIPLDEVPTESYNWLLMGLEESVDMNQYLTREIRRLQQEVEFWKDYASRKALNKKIESLKEENEKLKKELNSSNRWLLDAVKYRETTSMTVDEAIQRAKERVAHGFSD